MMSRDTPLANHIIDAALPGRGVVMTLHAFFDESESAEPSVYGVAGYVFESEAAKRLETEWQVVLSQYDLPYFHMIDCAHGAGIFKNVDKTTRIEIQTKVFEVLKRHALIAVFALFDMRLKPLLDDPSWVNRFALENGEVHSPHSLCCYWCVRTLAEWAQNRQLPRQDILYFFEAGASDQGITSRLLNTLSRYGSVTEKFHYAGHAFLKKQASAGVQCADILAWQVTKAAKNKILGRPDRADYRSLQSIPCVQTVINQRTYLSLVKRFDRMKRFVDLQNTGLVWWFAELQKDGTWLLTGPGRN